MKLPDITMPGGLLPGLCLYLATFYPRKQLQLRYVLMDREFSLYWFSCDYQHFHLLRVCITCRRFLWPARSSDLAHGGRRRQAWLGVDLHFGTLILQFPNFSVHEY